MSTCEAELHTYDSDEHDACPQCEQAFQTEAARVRKLYAASPRELTDTEYRAQLIDAGRGHLVSR